MMSENLKIITTTITSVVVILTAFLGGIWTVYNNLDNKITEEARINADIQRALGRIEGKLDMAIYQDPSSPKKASFDQKSKTEIYEILEGIESQNFEGKKYTPLIYNGDNVPQDYEKVD